MVYARDADVARLVAVLAPYGPYLRGAPPALPFTLDEQTVARGLNVTLVTTRGDLARGHTETPRPTMLQTIQSLASGSSTGPPSSYGPEAPFAFGSWTMRQRGGTMGT